MGSSFHVENFGCRAARADGEAIADRLRAAGCCESQPTLADVVIVNTCWVTAEADREARAYIRRARRLNPDARIVATGCYAQRAPQELAALPGVAAVIGNSHKAFAPEIALSLLETSTGRPPESPRQPINELVQIQMAQAGVTSSQVVLADDRFAHSFLEEAALIPGAQTRPNLKIQEGCGNRCTFCVIPQTRGPSRSLPAATILRQVQGFVAAGGKELVLSGINLGRWGRDLAPSAALPRPTLPNLVRAIFEQSRLPRLRLSSIEPMDWDADLIALMAEFGGSAPGAPCAPASCNRAPTRFCAACTAAIAPGTTRKKLPRCSAPPAPISLSAPTSWWVFPAKPTASSKKPSDLIRALPFGYLHLFPFSPRPGTRPGPSTQRAPVPAAVVEERMAALRALAAEKSEHASQPLPRPRTRRHHSAHARLAGAIGPHLRPH